MESIGRLMPAGPSDRSVHRGARRKSTRFPIHGEVRVTAPLAAEGFLLNASTGGLRLALDRPVEVGARLELEVRFDERHEARERGEVVWTREHPDGWLVGLRFAAPE